jgi:hypothetical protein
VILPQNIIVMPHGPKCKHGSFCSIFDKLSEYCNLEITLWGKQELLVIQKTIIFQKPSENHSLKNSSWGEQGLLMAEGLYIPYQILFF